MAYINKRDRFNAIKKVTIQFGKFLGCPEDADAEIVVREPSELEVLDWREANQVSTKEGMSKFKEMLTGMIVSHNLMEDESEKMKTSDVVDLIYAKTDLTSHIVSQWSKSVFPSPTNKREGK